MLKNILKMVSVVVIVFLSLFSAISCSVSSDGFYFASLGLNEGRIFIANSVTGSSAYTVTMYNLDGELLGVVYDTTNAGKPIQGLAKFGSQFMVAATDTPDELVKIDIFSGTATAYAQDALLSGAIYDVQQISDETYFVSEDNNVERFDSGNRNPAAGPAYIPSSTGACSIIAARGLTVTGTGDLALVSNLNDRINFYDVSGATVTCAGFVAVTNPDQPYDAIGHSNGNIYMTGFGTDSIFTIDPAYSGYVTLVSSVAIDEPYSIEEHPSGDLLVAVNGSIEAVMRVTTGGVITQFIKNAFTTDITDIVVIPAQ